MCIRKCCHTKAPNLINNINSGVKSQQVGYFDNESCGYETETLME